MKQEAQDAPSTADRICALLDHLGIATAHVATQMPGDLAGFAVAHPGRLAGAVLAVPVRLDSAPFAGVAGRMLIVAGDTGMSAEVAGRAQARLEGARLHRLGAYEAPGWSDVAADRTAELADVMSGFLLGLTASRPSRPVPSTGTHAGLAWRAEGEGPALLLLPFFLAPSQWEPIVPALARRFTVVRIGGPHVGGVAALEDRARQVSYQALFRTLIDHMAPAPGERILDVGCGSGSLSRALARRLRPTTPVEAVDINGYLLAEAASLAAAEGLSDAIRFSRGSATELPFPDASIDHAFSVTVLEECDARRAIAEIKRVVRPGGRIGIIVRAIDMPQWWNVSVPPGIKAVADISPQSVGTGGVADARLYAMMQEAGLFDMIPFPSLMTIDRPDGPLWRYREDALLAALGPAERSIWERARETARSKGLLFQAHALHCAVATKPS